MHGHSWRTGGGDGNRAGRQGTQRGQRVGTGRGQAGKTFKENKRGFDGKWAGRGRQAGLREDRLMGRKRTGMQDRTLREDR